MMRCEVNYNWSSATAPNTPTQPLRPRCFEICSPLPPRASSSTSTFEAASHMSDWPPKTKRHWASARAGLQPRTRLEAVTQSEHRHRSRDQSVVVQPDHQVEVR